MDSDEPNNRDSGSQRRTNPQRSRDTREKAINSAIDCLSRLGYAASNTRLIADMCNLSRGALTYHFPTKVDLMIAVVEHYYEIRVAYYNDALLKLPKGLPRWLGGLVPTLEIWREPAGVAVIEITIAANSDEELAKRLRPILYREEADQREKNWAIAKSAGITDRKLVEASSQLDRAVVRGLCLDLMHKRDRTDVMETLDLMIQYKTEFFTRLIESSQSAE